MRFHVKLAALLTLALLPLSAAATEYKDGTTPSNGQAPFSAPVGGWDGAHHRAWRVDSNGIGRVTEEYPATAQRVSVTVAASVPVTQGFKAIGNGYSISPYSQRVLHILRTPGSSACGYTKLYFYTSDDNVNFRPLMIPSGTAGAAATGTNFISNYRDTTKADTLQIRLPETNMALDAYYTISNDFSLGPYVQFWASRQDSAAATSTTALTLTWLLREQ